jgi:lipopolysaccharide transport system ATP-binding protein
MNDDILVKVDHVSKKFCRSLKKSLWYGVKDIAGELNPFANQKPETGNLKPEVADEKSETGASTEESFQVSSLTSQVSSSSLRDGEFYAVRDVSFTLRRGECLGLIAALIALGDGFNPILTGRENIYVNGLIAHA